MANVWPLLPSTFADHLSQGAPVTVTLIRELPLRSTQCVRLADYPGALALVSADYSDGTDPLPTGRDALRRYSLDATRSSTPAGGQRLKVPVDHVSMMSVVAKSELVCEPSTGRLWGLFRHLRLSAILESNSWNSRPSQLCSLPVCRLYLRHRFPKGHHSAVGLCTINGIQGRIKKFLHNKYSRTGPEQHVEGSQRGTPAPLTAQARGNTIQRSR